MSDRERDLLGDLPAPDASARAVRGGAHATREESPLGALHSEIVNTKHDAVKNSISNIR